MSQTVPADVVSRSYWAYVASAMVSGLGLIVEKQVPPTQAIPRRVYLDAHQFFHVALEAAGNAVPDNPSASIANYIIAAGAAKVVIRTEADRSELESRLSNYVNLLTRLEGGFVPLNEDLGTALALRQFFSQVQRDAEAEVYERVVGSQTAPSGFVRSQF